ncbi:MAG: hypothetical protein K9K82_12390 [Desulfobacteraceae bacterium]|nr:hypothetical protein [Desulfobacteraceae bacterium]
MNKENNQLRGKMGCLVCCFCRVAFAVFVFLSVCPVLRAGSVDFKAASWNLENLFDLKYDGGEYPGYVPGGDSGWDRGMLEIKLDNLSRVICDISPEVIGLQEIESGRALELLCRRLRNCGADYPYAVIADKKPTTVKCALLSKYPVVSAKEIRVPGDHNRNIFRADIDVSGNRLVVFVNHWKSKSGPESRRLVYAEALAAAVKKMPEKTDYLLMGDFNSSYNEFKTLAGRPALNDTGGITGINHVLNTVSGGVVVDERRLVQNPSEMLHYNLWLEKDRQRRWSALFFGRPRSPDAILLPAALYDDHGISYEDNSFNRFDPGYLFKGDRLNRWQRADRGRGRHLGRGFSDHLPVYARFSSGPFSFKEDKDSGKSEVERAPISALYNSETGPVGYRLKQCAVIYRHKDNAVIKQKNGRAIYVYKEAQGLEQGRINEIVVSRLKRYYGNLEITGIDDIMEAGKVKDPEIYYLSDPDADFSDPLLENEVIARYSGVYKNGRFFYGKEKQIRLYFRDKALIPETPARIRVRHARIGYHKSPELVIEKREQIEAVPCRKDPEKQEAEK